METSTIAPPAEQAPSSFDPTRGIPPKGAKQSSPEIAWDNAMIAEVLKWWRSEGHTEFTAADLHNAMVAQGVEFPGNMDLKTIRIKLSMHLKGAFTLEFKKGIGGQIFIIEPETDDA